MPTELTNPILVALTLLAACSSSGSDTVAPELGPLLAEDVGTVAEAFAAGRTLVSGNRMSAAYIDNDTTSTSRAAGSPEFTIAKNDHGAVDITIDGIFMSYAPEDLSSISGWVKTSGAHTVELYGWSSTAETSGAEHAIEGINTYGDYHQVWGYI